MKRLRTALVLILSCLMLHAQKLPSPTSVLEAMHRANDYFVRQHPDPTKPTFVKKERPSNLWTRGVYFEGLMELNTIDPQPQNIEYVRTWAEFHKFTPRNGVFTRDADDYCCCQTYLAMNMQRKAYGLGDDWDKTLSPTIACMENLLTPAPENMTPATKARYGSSSLHDWTWIDAIQMGLPVLTYLPVALSYMDGTTAQRLDFAEHGYRMYTWTRDTLAGGLFNQEESLWWRDKDFVPPYKEPNGRNCYWSRGNGWVYAALVRAMNAALAYESLYHSQPAAFHFRDYLRDYQQMSAALLSCQRKDGFWNVSLHDAGNYGGRELTGTALFVYGMAWGVRHDYLNKDTYLPVIIKSWKAMVKCVRKDGFLHYVQGTGKEPKDSQPVGKNIEPDFDDFGLGCFLLAGSEVYRLCQG